MRRQLQVALFWRICVYFLVYALISSLLVAAILAATSVRPPIAIWKVSALTGAAVGLAGWLVMPIFAWNFAENWELLLFVGAVTVGTTFRKPFSSPLIAWAPIAIALMVLLVVRPIATMGMFHGDAYRELLGTVNTREFSSDMSPVSLDQLRRVDQLLARTLGEKRLEEIPGLGSRVRLGTMNIQSVNGCFGIREGNGRSQELCLKNKLMWAGPLVHESFLKFWANGTTPGYILVSATDPSDVYFVTAIRSRSGAYEPVMLKYFRDGYLGSYVERHLRTAGDISSGFAEYAFEINDEGRPYWVTARYRRKIGFDGADATGVIFVDAQSGQINESTIDLAPTWIDRIQPAPIVTAQLDNWGLYVKGWWNSVFARQDVIQTTPGMSQDALRDYQNSIVRQAQRLTPDGPARRKRIDATVLAATKNGEFYFLLITGQDGKEFYGSSSVSPELRWTKPGDTVAIEVDEGDLRSIPIGRFDNKGLSISFFD